MSMATAGGLSTTSSMCSTITFAYLILSAKQGGDLVLFQKSFIRLGGAESITCARGEHSILLELLLQLTLAHGK